MKVLPEMRVMQRGSQLHLVALGVQCGGQLNFLMNSRQKTEKWLLSDWSSDNDSHETLETSDVEIATSDKKNDEQTAEVTTEKRVSKANEIDLEIENKKSQEGDDFSPSTSSWKPSDGILSSDDSDMEVAQSKTLKMEQHIRQYTNRRNGKKNIPMRRPNAVVKVLRERQININRRTRNCIRKRKYPETNKKLRKNVSLTNVAADITINVNVMDFLKIKNHFTKMIKCFPKIVPQQEINVVDNKTEEDISIKIIQDENEVVGNVNNVEHGERSQSEESNRSDDNVLITNKYHNALMPPENQEKTDSHKENEWIPIGSGKTLIHKDKYKKINWKSYTIATRSLLLATFTRRVLATHSLTGKRSPAFQNKAPKMCLDPKIVSDIIIEITDKFKVKENLVRSIITTKCADECKMYKMRLKNKNAQLNGLKELTKQKESKKQ